MKISKAFLLPALLLLCLLLSGCSQQNGLRITDYAPLATPIPREMPYVAPIGDAGLEYACNAEVYFPAYDGRTLVHKSTRILYAPSRPFAEALVRTLLDTPAESGHDSLGGSVKLTLYGSTPVEVSRNTAVVHLSATAKQLEKPRQYLVCQAIANSLCSSTSIQNVAFLIGGRPFALDLAEQLPGGVFDFQADADSVAQYQQKLSSAQAFADFSEKNHTARTVLYYPISGADGVLAHAQPIALDSPMSGNVLQALLAQLSVGSPSEDFSSPALSGHVDFLTAVPRVAYSSEAHGNVIDLRFADNWSEMLDAYNLSKDTVLASLCLSLCTYVPDVVGLSVSIGGSPVDESLLIEDTDSGLPNGELVLRKDVGSYLLDTCTLYLPQKNSREVVAVQRPIPFMQSSSPRALLSQLSLAALPCDSRTDTLPALPALTDTDLIGLCLEDDLLLVNLALSFMRGTPLPEGVSERQTVYAMVNTLCASGPYQAVCFIQGGAWPEGFHQTISWEGAFYPLPVAESPKS